MNTLSINFAAWNAWQQLSATPDQWQHLGRDVDSEAIDTAPTPSSVPAMLRRRLGVQGKLATSSAEEAAKGINEPFPTVFSSQHGDLYRTLELLESLAAGEPLSPTNFSLSVHNAIAGIYAIARKDQSATTALSCAHDDVSTALLESQLILEEQQCHHLLCIVHDQNPPEFFRRYGLVKATTSYAAAFLLSAEPDKCTTTYTLSLSQAHEQGSHPLQPSAISLIEHLNQNSESPLHFSVTDKLWTWNKAR